jgi:single-strand DNA-binding protein
MQGYRLPELNCVILSGRLTRDPEIRYSPAGIAVALLPLALNRRLRDANGDWREETSYVTVSVFRRLAEFARERLHRGSAVVVEGRLHSRVWTGADGRTRKVLEVRGDRIQFLDVRSDSRDLIAEGPEQTTSTKRTEQEAGGSLPF